MRRYRRIGGYRSGQVKKSKKKILIRVAFVVVCACILTLVAVLLGTHLQKKADYSASISTENVDTTATTENIGDLFPGGIKVEDPEKAKLEVTAADIDITSGSADELKNNIYALSDKYNAISVRITSKDGKLVYISPALMEHVGLDTGLLPQAKKSDSTDEDKPEVNTYENLKAVLAAAKAKNLRAGIYFCTDPSALEQSVSAASKCEIDSVIISELAQLGYDEILIEGLVAEEGRISNDTLKSIIRYLALLREKSNSISLGIILEDSVYLVPQNASIIKTLSEYTDFLAISINTDLTDADEAYSAVYDNCYSLKGNFSVYNLRGVILAELPDVASAVHASLKALSAKSTQFTVYVADPSYTPPVSDSSSPDTAETGVANEHANRSENYEETTTTEEK